MYSHTSVDQTKASGFQRERDNCEDQAKESGFLTPTIQGIIAKCLTDSNSLGHGFNFIIAITEP